MPAVSPLQRAAVLVYGLICYVVFLGTFIYLVGFIGGLVPRSLDALPGGSTGRAIAVDALLVLLFGLQHSVMARPAFKRRLVRLIPEAAERSTFVLAASLALIVLFAGWQPLGGVVWAVETPLARGILWTGFGLGWLTVLGSTLLINHFDLFGLRQIWKYFRRLEYRPISFRTPGPYRLVRHPLYVGFLLAFWCAPKMTAAHLLFAALNTAYILIAIRFEERDLATFHGADYVEYKQRTPMLVPRLGARERPAALPTRVA